MHTADYLIIAIIVLSATIGLLRGFLREVIAVISWLLALFAAWHFSGLVLPHLGAIPDPALRLWGARTLVFVAVLLIGSAVGAIVGHFVRLSIFSGTDRFLGLIFGLLRAGVALGILALLGQLMRLDGESWWRESTLMPYVEKLGTFVRSIAGDAMTRDERALTAASIGIPDFEA